jgi:hypothetical protein
MRGSLAGAAAGCSGATGGDELTSDLDVHDKFSAP